MSGQAVIKNEMRIGAIEVFVQPDTEPEKQEEFTLVLSLVDGGAEINPTMNATKIVIL